MTSTSTTQMSLGEYYLEEFYKNNGITEVGDERLYRQTLIPDCLTGIIVNKDEIKDYYEAMRTLVSDLGKYATAHKLLRNLKTPLDHNTFSETEKILYWKYKGGLYKDKVEKLERNVTILKQICRESASLFNSFACQIGVDPYPSPDELFELLADDRKIIKISRTGRVSLRYLDALRREYFYNVIPELCKREELRSIQDILADFFNKQEKGSR